MRILRARNRRPTVGSAAAVQAAFAAALAVLGGLVAGLLLTGGCRTTTGIALGPPVPERCRVIGWGSDTVDEIYLAEHVAELEQRPLDGIVISLYPDGWTGSRRHRNRNWFGSVRYSVDDFTAGIERLRNCHFERLRDNFIDLPTTAAGPRLAEWFDPDWAEVVAGNVAVAARVAREAGFKGLFVDTEAYAYGEGVWRAPFSYRTYADACRVAGREPRSLRACRARIRRCGWELGRAVTTACPETTLVFMAGIGLLAEEPSQDLVPAFVDGVLEGAGPRVEIHDGGERAYPRKYYDSFRQLRLEAERRGQAASRVPRMFSNRVRYGFGIWVDCRPQVYGGWHTDDLTRNHKDGPGLEHTLYNALSVTDKYVWLYVWHPELWWTPSRGTANRICDLCPHEPVPAAYIDALRNCRNPHDLGWDDRQTDDTDYGPARLYRPDAGAGALFGDLDTNWITIHDFGRDTWQFRLDTERPFGFNSPVVDAAFEPIRIEEFWENQGYPYDGVGWYRLWFDVPPSLADGTPLTGRRFKLAFGGVGGSVCTWIWRRNNGPDDDIRGYAHGHAAVRKAGVLWNYVELPRQHLNDVQQAHMFEPIELDVSMIVRPGARHLLVVRVQNFSGPGGIWRPLRLYASRD